MLWTWVLTVACLDVSDAFGYFKDRIPNGHNVTVNGVSWRAVGHAAPFWRPDCFGAFERCNFGIDFEKNGFRWNEWLCRRDSDYDGSSNGEELGDPHCLFGTPAWEEWVKNNPRPVIRHPGLNEYSQKCISGRRKCSDADLSNQVRIINPGEEVRTSFLTIHNAKSEGFEHATVLNYTPSEMEPHEVKVNLQFYGSEGQGAIVQKLPRTWMMPMITDVNASVLSEYMPDGSFPVTGNASESEMSSFNSRWYMHNLVVSSCSKVGHHPKNWFPIGELIFIFVNVVIPIWAFVNWVDLRAKDQWHKVNVWKIWAMVFLITQVGVSTGFHRHFTHKTFKAKTVVAITLAMIGQLALQGDAFYWSALHRTHHHRCDQSGDPHSPVIGGFFHSHGGFVWNDGAYDFRYRVLLRDLNMDVNLSWIKDQGIISIVGLPLLSHLVFGRHNTLWYLHVPQFLGWQVTQIVNSICHLWGYSPYANDAMSSPCVSKNSPWMWALVYGEIWHNNHHATPSKADFGVSFWEIDPAHLLISFLESLGLVWDVKRDGRIQDEVPSLLEALKVLGSCIAVYMTLKAVDHKMNEKCSKKPVPPQTWFQGGLLGILCRSISRRWLKYRKMPNGSSHGLVHWE
eukprot:gnl/MRDRNA2_/MRDRNA2_128748_c0_seq1.p1 gnl/MRDRNA2_/MRDRNA2_128748_c0~~gnl/MRDRNA2_/MRDRNA2_128748_c0_seq1.p1  ORF type:complete len:624 (-),score=49.41 gnl/MRDRNA2_/MRDRNA2_128748_c0_seq1:94-1965(-)